MKKKPEDYLKEPYSRVLLPEEDGRFSAEILEFPGCFAQGDNPGEAFDNLEMTAKSWIIASLDQGLEIPSPALNQYYSGKISLRIPRSLHKKAAQFAERDAISLNQFFISAIASKIGADEYHSYLFERIEKLISHNVADKIKTTNPQDNTLKIEHTHHHSITISESSKPETMMATMDKLQSLEINNATMQ
jgi:antitoxin HicB